MTLRHHLEHASALRVTSTVSGAGGSTPAVGIKSRDFVLGIGEEWTIAASVVCEGGRDGTVTVDVSVEGERSSIEFGRDVALTCTGESATDA